MVGYSNDNKSLVYLETLTQAYAINPGIWYLVEGMSEYLSFICSSFVEGYSVDLSDTMRKRKNYSLKAEPILVSLLYQEKGERKWLPKWLKVPYQMQIIRSYI